METKIKTQAEIDAENKAAEAKADKNPTTVDAIGKRVADAASKKHVLSKADFEQAEKDRQARLLGVPAAEYNTTLANALAADERIARAEKKVAEAESELDAAKQEAAKVAVKLAAYKNGPHNAHRHPFSGLKAGSYAYHVGNPDSSIPAVVNDDGTVRFGNNKHTQRLIDVNERGVFVGGASVPQPTTPVAPVRG